jgi:hypothetical protein
MGHAVRIWLRHSATSRKVSLEFFIDNPSVRTLALGLTQPLTEMGTRNISWGIKADGALG